MASTASTKSSRLGLTALIGVVVSVLGIWYALHGISFSEAWDVARQVHVLPFVASIVLVTLTFPLRAIRWRYLLQLDGEKLPFMPLWHATAIGFMANNILPARAGEVARIYAAGKLTDVSYSASFASIAIERVFDGLIILLLVGFAFSFAELPGDIGVALVGPAKSFALLFVGLLAFSMFAVHKPEIGLKIANRISHSILPERWATKSMSIARGLLSGLDSLKDPRRFVAVFLWSFGVWVANGVSFWIGFMAFDIDVPLAGAFILQAVIAFSVAVPAAPGYVGVFEAAIKGTLLIFGIAATRSVSFALLFHLGGFIPITLLGFMSLARARFSLSDLTNGNKGTP